MAYRDLYNHIQNQKVHISRVMLRDMVVQLTGIGPIATVRSDMDITRCRGFFLSAENQTHRLVEQCGGKNVIVVSRSLNRCWERFVITKELMHLFDGNADNTDQGDQFESVLNNLSGPGIISMTPQLRAEIVCFWRALAVLCPEKDRQRLKEKKENGLVDDYGIALELRIPEQYVPQLFSATFEEEKNKLLKV